MNTPESAKEAELDALYAAGWSIDESGDMETDPTKLHIFAPSGSAFLSTHLLQGSPYACDHVTELSSIEIIEEERTARHILALQEKYRKQYGCYYNIRQWTPEQIKASQILF